MRISSTTYIHFVEHITTLKHNSLVGQGRNSSVQ